MNIIFSRKHEGISLKASSIITTVVLDPIEIVWDMCQGLRSGIYGLTVLKKITGDHHRNTPSINVLGVPNDKNGVLIKFQSKPDSCYRGVLKYSQDGGGEMDPTQFHDMIVRRYGQGWFDPATIMRRQVSAALPATPVPSEPPPSIASPAKGVVDVEKKLCAKGFTRKSENIKALCERLYGDSGQRHFDGTAVSVMVGEIMGCAPGSTGRITDKMVKLGYFCRVKTGEYYLTQKASDEFGLEWKTQSTVPVQPVPASGPEIPIASPVFASDTGVMDKAGMAIGQYRQLSGDLANLLSRLAPLVTEVRRLEKEINEIESRLATPIMSAVKKLIEVSASQ